MLFNIALIYYKFENITKAISYMEMALEIFVRLNAPFSQKASDAITHWKNEIKNSKS
jgi:hypothetical protein